MSGLSVRRGSLAFGGGAAEQRAMLLLGLFAALLMLPFMLTNPELVLLMALLPFVTAMLRWAAVLLLIFIAFSFFRMHEAYPFLLDFSLPLLFGGAGTIAFVYLALKSSAQSTKVLNWQSPALLFTGLAVGLGIMAPEVGGDATAGQRLMTFGLMFAACSAFLTWTWWLEEVDGQRWGPEMKIFAAYFIFMSIGVPLARDMGPAHHYWTLVFWKIAATTLALAWLIKTPQRLVQSLVTVVTVGSLIGCVAIYNGLNGIDLVEGTRVTIGRALYSSPELIALNLKDPISHPLIGSVLGDPNDLALVLLFPLGFAVAGALKPGLSPGVRWLCMVSMPIVCLAIVYTQSRGGALGMVAVIGVVSHYIIRSKVIKLSLLAIVSIGLFFGMALSERRSGGAAELAASATGIDESASGRLHAWQAAISMARSRPLTGVGMNSFTSHFFEHTPVWGGMNKAVHSTWFAALAEGGVPGLIIFVMLFWAALRSTVKIKTKIDEDPTFAPLEPIRIGIVASVVGFGVSAAFLTQHIHWPLFVQLAFAIALTRYIEATSAKPARVAEAQ